MSEPLQQPLQGASLYNPHLHGKEELIGFFAARGKLLDLLLEDLRAASGAKSPQHHLLIGQRGMGKTMLLHRLAYAIEDDPELSQKLLPLTFPEEQYNLARLSDFWLNCTDALSDVLERTGRTAEARRLDERTEALRTVAEERRAKDALALLTTTAKSLGRRLVLLVDNIDLVLERVHQQQWILREALSAIPSFVLIGASVDAVESSYSYGQAFYDFFRVHELEGLDLEETRALIIHYAESLNNPVVKRLVLEDPTRIRVLHTLTGGNPRTIVLLFNVMALDARGDIRTDLEMLLDQCTPLYKARVEALPSQAQQVVHAMAVHWDPISAGELAGQLRMEVNAVSSHLTRLVKQGVLEKVEYDPESKIGFQIAERFFNIWYLMRASRRVRRRLLWFVDFLKTFYSQEQLRARALQHIELGLQMESSGRLRYAEYSFALAGAIADRSWSNGLEESGALALLRDDALRRQLPELLDPEESEPNVARRIELRARLEAAREGVLAARPNVPEWSGEEFWNRLRESLQLSLEHKVLLAEHISNIEEAGLTSLRSFLESEPVQLKYLYSFWLRRSAELKRPPSASKVKKVIERVVVLANRDEDLVAELGSILIEQRRLAEAENVFRDFLLGNGNSARIWYALGMLLGRLNRQEEAEAALRKSLEIDPQDARAWTMLGNTVLFLQRLEDAEEAHRRALEIEETWRHWLVLGIDLMLLRRTAEAEKAYRHAIRLNHAAAVPWAFLGKLLEILGRYDEAEQAFRKAVELEPEQPLSKAFFAWFLLFRRHDYEAAEKLARESADFYEESNGILAITLARKGKWNEAVVYMKKLLAAILDEDPEGRWPETLAVFKEAVRSGRAREAAELLDETGAGERWRPLREAVEAAARGSESYLRRVAPEVRPSAREIFKQLVSKPSDKAEEKPTPRALRTRGRKRLAG